MTEEPGMRQSMGSQRVRHGLVTEQQERDDQQLIRALNVKRSCL